MILQILFWILLILSAIGIFAPDTYPNIHRGRFVVTLILLGILGYFVLNNPLHK